MWPSDLHARICMLYDRRSTEESESKKCAQVQRIHSTAVCLRPLGSYPLVVSRADLRVCTLLFIMRRSICLLRRVTCSVT